MKDKVYILLDVMDGKSEQVVHVLQEIPGVLMVDALEGPPDIVVIIEAPEREQLAKWTIEALSSVEMLTKQVRLLPTRDGSNRMVTKLRSPH